MSSCYRSLRQSSCLRMALILDARGVFLLCWPRMVTAQRLSVAECSAASRSLTSSWFTRRCASLDELCHNEMSRDHDAPVEYLRKLASLKLRFGLAALGTARGALPVSYPIEEQGHSATQSSRWSSTYPIEEPRPAASHRLVIDCRLPTP